jgi:hypothetical protein
MQTPSELYSSKVFAVTFWATARDSLAAMFPPTPRTMIEVPFVNPCGSSVVITIGFVLVAFTMCGIESQNRKNRCMSGWPPA